MDGEDMMEVEVYIRKGESIGKGGGEKRRETEGRTLREKSE